MSMMGKCNRCGEVYGMVGSPHFCTEEEWDEWRLSVDIDRKLVPGLRALDGRDFAGCRRERCPWCNQTMTFEDMHAIKYRQARMCSRCP